MRPVSSGTVCLPYRLIPNLDTNSRAYRRILQVLAKPNAAKRPRNANERFGERLADLCGKFQHSFLWTLLNLVIAKIGPQLKRFGDTSCFSSRPCQPSSEDRLCEIEYAMMMVVPYAEMLLEGLRSLALTREKVAVNDSGN